MLGLAVAAALGALAGPFSVVIPLVVQGLLWLAGQRGAGEEGDEGREIREMQRQLGAIELVSVWISVLIAGHWVAPEGHYLVVAGLVAVTASATTAGLVAMTRVFNNALVALVPAAAVASAAAALAGRFVL